MTNIAKKSILARLLARENITVEQTNHHTAFFDVERRILGLPYWKDVGNDLYDLLVGHEIGQLCILLPLVGTSRLAKFLDALARILTSSKISASKSLCFVSSLVFMGPSCAVTKIFLIVTSLASKTKTLTNSRL